MRAAESDSGPVSEHQGPIAQPMGRDCREARWVGAGPRATGCGATTAGARSAGGAAKLIRRGQQGQPDRLNGSAGLRTARIRLTSQDRSAGRSAAADGSRATDLVTSPYPGEPLQ